jgi:hypothetical protein
MGRRPRFLPAASFRPFFIRLFGLGWATFSENHGLITMHAEVFLQPDRPHQILESAHAPTRECLTRNHSRYADPTNLGVDLPARKSALMSPPVAEGGHDEDATALIRQIHGENYQVYSVRKIGAEPRRQGQRVARCTVRQHPRDS